MNLVCDNGWTALGENVYAVGNLPSMGGWNPEKVIKLQPSVYYEYIYNLPPNHNGPGPNTPKWTGVIQELPVKSSVEWKCVKHLASGQWQWQPGGNNIVSTPSSGYAGMSIGTF